MDHPAKMGGLGWTLIFFLVDSVSCQAIYQLLAGHGLTEFEKVVNESFAVRGFLSAQSMPLTVFVPTNEAMRRWRTLNTQESFSSDILQNHIAPGEWSQSKLIETAQSSLKLDRKIKSSYREAPLWLQYFFSSSEFPSKLFVNNAKIISETKTGNQIMFIVDDVIAPVGTTATAKRFIEDPAAAGHRDLSSQLDEIKREVEQLFEHSLEDDNSVSTFFLPNDAAFEGLRTRGAFDRSVLRGHIVPNELLFLNAMSDRLAELHTGSLPRPLGFTTQNDESPAAGFTSLIVCANHTTQPQIFSLTTKGNNAVPQGRVYARIVKANIPVGNGVVHIIERVLLLVEQNARDLLLSRDNLRNFREWLNVADATLFNEMAITSDPGLTLFVPSNEAIAALPRQKINQLHTDKDFLNRIIKMHMVPGRLLRADDIVNGTSVFSAAASSLTLHVRELASGKEFFVDGGGVKARIVQPDIASTNAVIHVIDEVLGIPFMNVFEKLKADQTLKRTYSSVEGSRELRSALQSVGKNYTVFAPSDNAWTKLKPQDRDALYARPDLLGKVLKRHIVAGRRMDGVYLKSGEKVAMMLGEVSIRQSKETRDLLLEWKGHAAKLITYDLGAVNGVVHVIDQVLFDRDIDITSSAAQTPLVSAIISTAILINLCWNYTFRVC